MQRSKESMEQKRKSIFDILLISKKKTKEKTQGNGNINNKRIKIIVLSIIIMESIFIMLDKTKWNPNVNLWELIAKFIVYDFLISIGFIFVCGVMLQIFFFIQTMIAYNRMRYLPFTLEEFEKLQFSSYNEAISFYDAICTFGTREKWYYHIVYNENITKLYFNLIKQHFDDFNGQIYESYYLSRRFNMVSSDFL